MELESIYDIYENFKKRLPEDLYKEEAIAGGKSLTINIEGSFGESRYFKLNYYSSENFDGTLFAESNSMGTDSFEKIQSMEQLEAYVRNMNVLPEGIIEPRKSSFL